MKTKTDYEFAYWTKRKSIEGMLKNGHYEHFYTTHFHLKKNYYDNKKILDIGCGPRGSLEWAEMADQRIGIDPLADAYLKIGAARHGMQYIAGRSEDMPFSKVYFDVVCSFNSMDHVDDLDKTIHEIFRIIKPGGLFLLLTDVNHKPTHCEPISFSFDIVKKFMPQLTLLKFNHYEKKAGGMYESILANIVYDHHDKTDRYGILSAKFVRNGEN